MRPTQNSGLRTQRILRPLLILFLSSEFCFLNCGRAHASAEADAFALNGVGARPGGMGGAFIGLSDDIESVYYNPAGLGNLTQSGATAMYQTPSLETSRGFLAANKAWDHPVVPGSVALGWLRLQSKNIELTSAEEDILGSDTLANDLLMLGVGIRPFEHISIGASVKYFRFSFDGFNESGVGLDMGMHAHYGVFRVGAALTDLDGTRLSGDSVVSGAPDASDKVPMRFRPGVAVVLEKPLSIPIDLNFVADEMLKMQGPQETRLSTGLEIWTFEKRAALRTGYQQASGPTLGLGVRVGKLQVDYSYLFSLHLQDENRLGLTFHF
jgi:hypothetical protein